MEFYETPSTSPSTSRWDTSGELDWMDIDEDTTASSSIPDVKPTIKTEKGERNSGRIRKRSTEPFKFVDESITPSEWTRDEKERLLAALKKYGHLDIEKLCEAVPTKSGERIKLFINSVWKASRMSLLKSAQKKHEKKTGYKLRPTDKSYLAPIDQWLELMKEHTPFNYDQNRAISLAKAGLIMGKFEKHPDPSVCGGVDFRALYDFLFSMMSGYPPKALDPATTKFLLIVMRNFGRKLGRKKYDAEKAFLEQPLIPKFLGSDPNVVCEKWTNETEDDASFRELLKIQGFNPFNVPLELLVRKF